MRPGSSGIFSASQFFTLLVGQTKPVDDLAVSIEYQTSGTVEENSGIAKLQNGHRSWYIFEYRDHFERNTGCLIIGASSAYRSDDSTSVVDTKLLIGSDTDICGFERSACIVLGSLGCSRCQIANGCS